MGSYSVRADETELASLVSRAEAGEEIVLSRDGLAVAKIIPFPVAGVVAESGEKPQRYGQAYGQNISGVGRLPDNFADPLPEEYQRAFGMIE